MAQTQEDATLSATPRPCHRGQSVLRSRGKEKRIKEVLAYTGRIYWPHYLSHCSSVETHVFTGPSCSVSPTLTPSPAYSLDFCHRHLHEALRLRQGIEGASCPRGAHACGPVQAPGTGRHRWAREQARSRAGLQRTRSCPGWGGRAGCRRRPPDPARSSGSQAVGTVGTGGEVRREAPGGHRTESFKGRWRETQRSSWGRWMPLKHMLPTVKPSTSHQ